MFTEDEIAVLAACLLNSFSEAESIFNRSVNYNPEYAFGFAAYASKLEKLYCKLTGNSRVECFNSSLLDDYLHGHDPKLELI